MFLQRIYIFVIRTKDAKSPTQTDRQESLNICKLLTIYSNDYALQQPHAHNRIWNKQRRQQKPIAAAAAAAVKKSKTDDNMSRNCSHQYSK